MVGDSLFEIIFVGTMNIFRLDELGEIVQEMVVELRDGVGRIIFNKKLRVDFNVDRGLDYRIVSIETLPVLAGVFSHDSKDRRAMPFSRRATSSIDSANSDPSLSVCSSSEGPGESVSFPELFCFPRHASRRVISTQLV